MAWFGPFIMSTIWTQAHIDQVESYVLNRVSQEGSALAAKLKFDKQLYPKELSHVYAKHGRHALRSVIDLYFSKHIIAQDRARSHAAE